MNLKTKIILPASFIGILSFGQVGVNIQNPHASAMLEVNSETKGLLIPGLDQAQVSDLTNVPESLMLFNTSLNKFDAFTGTIWSQSPFYSQDFWAANGNSGTVMNTTNIVGTTDSRIFNIRTNNSKAMHIEANSQVRLGDREISGYRLKVDGPEINSPYPTIVAQHSTGFGSGVIYPKDISVTNTGNSNLKGNLSFSDNIADAENGISVAGISYFHSSDENAGFSLYTGGHPASLQDRSFERMKIAANGNVGLGTSVPVSKLQIEEGDIFITDPSRGIVINSGNGCYRITVSNSGVLTPSSIPCP